MTKKRFTLERMEPKSGQDRHHVIIARGEDDDWETTILHPESCRITLSDPADEWGLVRRYFCPLASEIENVGYDTIFGDERPQGVFLVRVWWTWHPSNINHMGEMDAGVEVTELSDLVVCDE